MKFDIHAPIPESLQPAHQLLTDYGRAVRDRPWKHRCGSIESFYVPERASEAQQEARRQPKEVVMHVDEVMRCQRALASVPDRERVVLVILYVPMRLPPEVLLRKAMIPARVSQERHLTGLRMFKNLHGVAA